MAPLQPGSPNQQIFADTLLALAERDRNILVVTSDSRGSGRLVAFGKRLPQQIVEVGIAEQNLVGVAAVPLIPASPSAAAPATPAAACGW